MYGRQLLRVSGIGLFLLPSILHALKRKKNKKKTGSNQNRDEPTRI